MRHLILLTALSLLSACNEQKENVLKTLPVYESLQEGGKQIDDSWLNEKIQIQSVTPLELTEASLLGRAFMVDEVSDKFMVCDFKSVYLFDNSTGKYLSSIKRSGEGPEDYLNILDLTFDSGSNVVSILDFPKKAINRYSVVDGKFLGRTKADSIVAFETLKNKNWVSFNSMTDTCLYDICISTPQGKLVWGRERTNTFIPKGYVPTKDFIKSNSSVYFYEKDTFFQIVEEGGLNPTLYIDKGQLSIPDEVLYDMKRKRERNQYVWGDVLCFSEKHCFITYYYNSKIYFDLWDISSAKLCYRNIFEQASDFRGLPFKVGNTTVYAWPSFVKDNVFYCVLDEGESGKLLTDENAESNPAVLKFRIE